MLAIDADSPRRSRHVMPCCLICLIVLGFGGCVSKSPAQVRNAMIPSARGFVLPGGEARAVQFMAGLAQPGSDFGPFSGRNDSKIGLNPTAGEKFEDQYDRRILDRQFTSLGRPFNIYQDTTRSISRGSR